ncbi:MAG: asparaginase [Rhodospirillaceae bacterium]|nr:asparaginase [Rhodospirillaceae bacterium]
MNIERTSKDSQAVERVYLSDKEPSEVVVEVTRGSMVESIHRGVVAVVDAAGKTVHAWGDIDRSIYGRSAIKPIQTLAVIESGAADAYALGEDEITLCCASHKGEPIHTDRVVPWLERLGLSADDLECGPQMPYHEATAEALIKAGVHPTRAHNNCSGKHSGMLTTASHLGEPTKGYSDPEHPVQTRLVRIMEEMAGIDLSRTARGVDGCGIPVYGAPVKALARAMARLADPSGLSDDRVAACRRIVKSCAAWPDLISGTGAFNSVVLAETGERTLLKGGAEGVYAAAVPELGLGICLKIDDGAGRASQVAVAAVLRRLGILDEAATKRLSDHVEPEVRNWAGTLVGAIRPGPGIAF